MLKRIKHSPCLLFFACCLMFYRSSAQTVLPQFAPPSPSAYSLGKYGDTPVNLYTGVPGITVPVYTLNSFDMNVGISLSYHASGVKVDEEATTVGLGWSLNAGGMITRTVRGQEDDVISRGEIDMGNIGNYPSHDAFITQNNLYSLASSGDTEPDEFFFNFNGRTGKFCLDKNRNVVLRKQEDLEIKMLQGAYNKYFVIKDEVGNAYEFSSIESSYSPNFSRQVISSWFLTKITSTSGNVISFIYSPANPVTHYVRSSDPTTIEVYRYGSNNYVNINVPWNSTYTFPNANNDIYEISLSKIVSNNGSVQFNYGSTPRKDMKDSYSNSTKPLEEIVVYRPDQSVLKRVKLTTSYFEANNSKKYDGYTPNLYPFLNYRLRLDAVQEFSADNVPLQPPYKFTYLGDDNPNTDDVYTLPHRLSAAQDYWGFSNGSYNTHVFPAGPACMATRGWYSILQTTDYGLCNLTYTNGANLEPDAEAVKAGVIRKVEYPTGGYSEFVFEPNYKPGFNFGGLRIKTILDHPLTGLPKETKYEYEGYSNFDHRQWYHQFYSIRYPDYQNTNPATDVLNLFNLPSGMPQAAYDRDFVRITPQPQAVLGRGAMLAYDLVKVSQTGNGYVLTTYDNSAYPDHDSGGNTYEPTQAEQNMVNNLFYSEFIDTAPIPMGPNIVYNIGDAYNFPATYPFDNSWKRGDPMFIGHYSEGGKLLKSENFTYNRKLLAVIPGFKVFKLADTYNQYLYSKYGVAKGLKQLKQKQTVIYDKDGLNPVTELTDYFYDSPYHFQVSRIEHTGSGGQKEVDNIVYPLDYSPGTLFIDNMKTSHVVARPVERIRYVEKGVVKSVLSGLYTEYAQDGKGYKVADYILQTAGPIAQANFKMSNSSTGVLPQIAGSGVFSPDSRYKAAIQYYGYNFYGNLKAISLASGPKTVYLYSYGGQYIIAEIKNADYAAVEALLGGTIAVNNFAELQPTDAQIASFLAPLRNPLNLPGTQVTTFTFSPLIGMTSMTDSKGMSTYYSYDKGQRLSAIRDHNGHLIRTYCYNYAGQLTDCNNGSGTSAPVQVYARIEVLNPTWGPPIDGSETEADIYLALYSDAACTHPVSLPQGFDVNVGTTGNYIQNNMSSVSSWTNSYSVPGNTDRVLLGRFITDSWYSYYDPSYGHMINSYNYTYRVEDSGTGIYIPSATH